MIRVPVEMLNEAVTRIIKAETTLAQNTSILNSAWDGLKLEAASRRTVGARISQARSMASRLSAEANRLSSYVSTCNSRFTEADSRETGSIKNINNTFKSFSQSTNHSTGFYAANASFIKLGGVMGGLISIAVIGGVLLPWIRERIIPNSTGSVEKKWVKAVQPKDEDDITNLPTSEDQMLLGSLSEKYESNGDPGIISSGYGDQGGASYGAYQFASALGVPYDFVQWLENEHPDYFERLNSAYNNDGNAYGSNFNSEWRAIAEDNSEQFLQLQHSYVKVHYYDKTVDKLVNDIGFDVNEHSIALQNVVWSRSVQHGWSGGASVITNAFEGIDLTSVSEEEMIRAIYSESGRVVDYPPHVNSQPMYDGRYMKYYSGNSAAVQQGVWSRLNEHELNDALRML